jgi:TolB-like protein/DNA-binding winged helix-turn-helix (wHTH) protein/Flp pilus assembly protein TadD
MGADDASQQPALGFGAFELDLTTGELRKGGIRLKLAPQPFKVLAMIARRGGEVVTREEIQREIWGSETFVDFELGMNHCIKQIRRVLSDSAETPRYIETLPRRGYRLIAPVQELPSRLPRVPTPATATLEGSTTRPEQVGGREASAFSRQWLRSRLKIAAGAVVLGLTALAIGWMVRGGGSYRSLAVLPFEDMSPEKNLAYLADGLSEELRNGLTRIEGLRVTGRTSSVQFKGKAEGAQSIGQKLKVAVLLEGTVRTQNRGIRVNVQLVKAADGFQLWSQTYDRGMDDIAAVQEEIARAVADELRPKLQGKKTVAASAQRPNPEVYNAYLHGKYFYGLRKKDNLEKSVSYFQQAVQLEPGYALAWLGLAKSYYGEADSGYVLRGDGYRKAREAASRALQLDPNLGEAYAALGWIEMHYEWNWREAEAYYRRALALDARDVTLLGAIGGLSFILGRYDEAIATYRQAIQIDPLHSVAFRNLGLFLYYAGRHKEAASALNQALELDPDVAMAHNILGLVYLAQTQPEAALAEANREGDAELRLQGLALAHHALGHKKDSDASLAELETKYSDDPYYIAEVYGFRREADRAFEWLERAYDQRDPGMTEIKGNPLLKSLERDSRYAALLRKMRLPL